MIMIGKSIRQIWVNNVDVCSLVFSDVVILSSLRCDSGKTRLIVWQPEECFTNNGGGSKQGIILPFLHKEI